MILKTWKCCRAPEKQSPLIEALGMNIALTCDSSFQELEDRAREGLRMQQKIVASKPVYSAQKLQHEYLENVSRIDRLSTFRGPRSASYRASRVSEHLDVAKSMRMSLHRPGTAGYQKDLSKSMKHQRSKSARTSGRYCCPLILCL
jgi:hypothetical protein